MRLPPLARLLRSGAMAVLAVAWVVLAHLGSAGRIDPDLAAALAVAPVVAAPPLLFWRAGQRGYAAAGSLGLLLLLLLVLWPRLRDNVALLYYLQHLGINLALAALFGRSLLRGREALISRVSRIAHHGVISPARAHYTRRVTIAWTAFFLASALLSTALYWLAAPAVWSVYANVLTGPLILLMFMLEYLVRRRSLPPEDRSGPVDAIRAYRASMRRPCKALADQP